MDRRREPGMTLLEVLISLAVLCIGILSVILAVISASVEVQSGREEQIAVNAARQKLAEILQLSEGTGFPSVFATYKASAKKTFPVPELPNATGTIYVPQNDAGQLVETPTGASWAQNAKWLPPMPRDMNGDGLTNGSDRSGDYTLLPIAIVVRWDGARGDQREAGYRTVLTQIR